MIRLHACQTASEQSEGRERHRVFLIRRYQVASADRAGDGCKTYRLLLAGLRTGAWVNPLTSLLLSPVLCLSDDTEVEHMAVMLRP
ncbi:hypothetical protein PBY51_006064 [Eleginops maclovinus]|uniref:Uncharacterized protein n=1 Tax=Eleginops maclovinus TaxID=56733 RepID=A0AAN7WT39_ELEMC|nr:hypothetical protein PBY51_006064 [Eleginops maclovinus]